MANERAAIVARARALIGVSFRPQGRSAETGLDCIGVVMMATGTPRARVREDYALRHADAEAAHVAFASCGFGRLTPGDAAAGDILLVESGHGRLHAVILTGDGHVHAHAGLRRVVETPGPVPWRILSAWRPDEV